MPLGPIAKTSSASPRRITTSRLRASRGSVPATVRPRRRPVAGVGPVAPGSTGPRAAALSPPQAPKRAGEQRQIGRHVIHRLAAPWRSTIAPAGVDRGPRSAPAPPRTSSWPTRPPISSMSTMSDARSRRSISGWERPWRIAASSTCRSPRPCGAAAASRRRASAVAAQLAQPPSPIGAGCRGSLARQRARPCRSFATASLSLASLGPYG